MFSPPPCRGAYAIVDPHNYGRYYNNIISDTAGFQAWWKTVASRFASNSRVIFDTNNEYHDMDNTLVGQLNQAAINGIRAAGAKTQYIFVEGNSWSGAWTWVCGYDAISSSLPPLNPFTSISIRRSLVSSPPRPNTPAPTKEK